MCSCRTQKLNSDVKVRNDVRSDLFYLNESVKISTQNHAYFANEAQRIVIEEVIIATEYDKETGKPTKETKTERKTTQDTDQMVTEEESEGVKSSNDLEVDYSAKFDENVDVETEEESIGAQESFGQFFGMGLACVIGVLVLYLLRKLRVN
jgi:hypothetical protein